MSCTNTIQPGHRNTIAIFWCQRFIYLWPRNSDIWFTIAFWSNIQTAGTILHALSWTLSTSKFLGCCIHTRLLRNSIFVIDQRFVTFCKLVFKNLKTMLDTIIHSLLPFLPGSILCLLDGLQKGLELKPSCRVFYSVFKIDGLRFRVPIPDHWLYCRKSLCPVRPFGISYILQTWTKNPRWRKSNAASHNPQD